jgi:pyruvate carboxylase
LASRLAASRKSCRKLILKDVKPYTERPNEHLAPVDFEKEWDAFKAKFGNEVKFTDLLSYLLYPKVFEQYYHHVQTYGDVSMIPTRIFFYGMKQGEEAIIDIARGKSIIVKYQSMGPANEDGTRTVFFKMNGQTRNIEVLDRSVKVTKKENRKADKADPKQIAAPLQGMLSKILVKEGQPVKKNAPLFIIEAMKMETTITAAEDLVITGIHLPEASLVGADDLILTTGKMTESDKVNVETTAEAEA